MPVILFLVLTLCVDHKYTKEENGGMGVFQYEEYRYHIGLLYSGSKEVKRISG